MPPGIGDPVRRLVGVGRQPGDGSDVACGLWLLRLPRCGYATAGCAGMFCAQQCRALSGLIGDHHRGQPHRLMGQRKVVGLPLPAVVLHR